MMNQTVLLDVDGVLADFAGALLRWAGPKHSREQLTEWDLMKALGIESRQAAFDEYASEPGFCESLPVIDGAQDFVESLRRVADIVIVTSPYSAARLWTFERLRWLEHHFGFSKYDVIFAKRKYLVQGDIMIDDGPQNIDPFVRGGGQCKRGILISQPWNAEHGDYPGATRAHSLKHALELVRE
jgi:5'(3')-deoxyribonucleotidase